MKKESTGLIFIELFLVVFIAITINFLFSQGVTEEKVSFVVFLLCLSIFPPLILETLARKVSFINAKSMILIGVLYWVLLDALVRRTGIELFSPEKILEVLLLIISFLIMVYVGYLIKWPDLFILIFKKLDYGYSFNANKLKNLILIYFFLGFLPIIIWGGGIDRVIWVLTHAGRWTGGWGRSRWGDWLDYIKSVLGLFNIIAIQLGGFYIIFIKKSLIFLILILVSLWIILVGGNRNTLGAAILPIFFLYFFKMSGKYKRYLIFVGIFLLFSVFEFQVKCRNYSPEILITDVLKEEFSNIASRSPIEYHRDDQFFQMLKYVTFVPSQIPHSQEPLILRPFYHFIPRAIWKNKPQGITRFFEEIVDESTYGLTTFAGSIIGDFYLANGWLGVLMAGLLMGFLAKQFDSLIDMSKRSPAILLIYAYGLIFLFVSIRSYQIIYEGWFAFIFLYLILKGIKKRGNISGDSLTM